MRIRALIGAVALSGLVVAGCGDDGASATDTPSSGAASGPADGTLLVLAEDIAFPQETYSVEAGVLEIDYENVGNIVHTLLITGVDGFKLTVPANGDTDSGTVDLAPGTYEMFCDIPGHRVAGMVATLEVR